MADPWTDAGIATLARLILDKLLLLLVEVAEKRLWIGREKKGNIVDLLSEWFVCTNINLLAECARLSLTLSLTVSLILATPAPALLTTPEKNEPNEVAPALTLLVTVGVRDEIREKNNWIELKRLVTRCALQCQSRSCLNAARNCENNGKGDELLSRACS